MQWKKHLNWKVLTIAVVCVIVFAVAIFYTDVLPPLRNEQPAVTAVEAETGQIKGAQTEEKEVAQPVPTPPPSPSVDNSTTENGSINVVELCKQALNYQKFYESLPWTPDNYDNQIAKKTYDELCGTSQERIKAAPENASPSNPPKEDLNQRVETIEKSVERVINRVF